MQEKKKSILIVDDDIAILRIVSRILQRAGYETDTVETGRDAIEKVRTKSYDLSLIDIRLPDMNGVELLSIMKTNYPEMRNIVITGFPSQENRTRCLQEGAECYLEKPVESQELLRIISEKLIG